jgi:hypothetical protein
MQVSTLVKEASSRQKKTLNIAKKPLEGDYKLLSLVPIHVQREASGKFQCGKDRYLPSRIVLEDDGSLLLKQCSLGHIHSS